MARNSSSTISSIQNARSAVSQLSEDQMKLLEPAKTSGKTVLDNISYNYEVLKNNTDAASLAGFSDIPEMMGELSRSIETLSQAAVRGEGAITDMADALAVTDEENTRILKRMMELSREAAEDASRTTKKDKEAYELRQQFRNAEMKQLKAQYKEEKKLREKQRKEYEKLLKESQQDLGKVFKGTVNSLARNVTDVIAKLDVHKMAQSLQSSTKTLLQRGFQLDYGINKSEFNKFKHDLFNSVDTSLYSSEQILASFDTFKNSYMKSSAITKQLQSDVIYGLNQLELSSSTQSSMLKQSNATGRNQLSFYQDNFAKYITSDLGIQRSQLNELVSMNQQLVDNAAALGIDSAVSNQTLLNEQTALEKYGLSGTYASSLNSMISNLTAPAVLLGMTSADLSDYLSSGGSYYDLLTKGNSPAMQYLRNAYNQGPSSWNTAKTVAQQAYGLDDATMELLRQSFKQGGTIDQSLKEVRDASLKSTDEAKAANDKARRDTTSWPAQIFNSLDNWFTNVMDWPIEDTVVGIFRSVTYIADLLSMEALHDLGNGASSLLKSTKLGKSVLGWLGSPVGKSAITKGGALGAGVAGVASLAMMGYDAYQMKDAGLGGWKEGGILRGALMGTGSSNKTTGENVQSVAGNTLKGALAGAAIGTLLGGPVVGTVIGGALGLGFGYMGTLLKDQTTLQEEQLEQQKSINRNTQDTAHQVGLVTHYRDSAYLAAGGDVSGYGTGVTYTHANKNIGGHKITSWYGKRGEIRNKKTNEVVAKAGFHSGIDVGMNAGTSLGAPYAGTVVFNGWRNRGGHNIDIMDANGYVHTFMHLQSKPDFRPGDIVSAGQFIGNAGSSGGNYSPHLHYSVSKGSYSHKNTIDPYDFLMSSSIFGGTGSAIPTVSNSDSVSDSLTSGSVNQTASLYTIGVGGDVGSSISSPIVNSIVDLRDTLVALNEKVSSQEKLMNLLTSQKTSPTI